VSKRKTEHGPRTSGQPDDPLVRLCRSLPGATEDLKWGDNLIFSVGGKMFAGFDLPELQPLSFKVDPVAFQTLIASPAFAPAPYMARHHWVTVADRDLVPLAMLEELIIEAHSLVASKLSRKARQALGIGDGVSSA
jgi:predicted DNA-binding protein (MmcQ/YjbR family)